jgi:hypothetical protein
MAISRSLLATLTTLTFTCITLAQPEPWVHPDNSIHWYDAVLAPEGITWHGAYAAAKVHGGYLATVTSAEENQFIFSLVDRDSFWAWRADPALMNGPWLGGWQPPGSPEPGGGWEWITREMFDLRNWSPGEPDDLGEGENALHFGGPAPERVQTWDDLDARDHATRGYVAELSADATTLGLLQSDSGASPGYTLLAPMDAPEVFLLDGKGRPVHSWRSEYHGAMGASLLEDGKLLRVGNLNTAPFYNGGVVELLDWDSRVLWSCTVNDSANAQHHDAILLPPGNLLMIAYEFRSRAEAIAVGRMPDRLIQGYLLPDKIIEVEPTTGNVVWEWRVWDHLIQDFDSTKSNFGVVAEHPGLVDVNYGPTAADWLHCNSIDYNQDLDQIIISNHNFGEVWAIDHSTTTEEARGHTGGRQGMGGDLLYRWGNPHAYRAGDSSSQRFFGQHSAHWIRSGLRGAGNILVFNNGLGRPAPYFSTVEEFTPPCDSTGRYRRPIRGEPFEPLGACWAYGATPKEHFCSVYISGAQRLANGNTLVCEGDNGHIFEVGTDSQVVWQYVNPVSDTLRLQQGETQGGCRVFRATRYPPDYPGLVGRELVPGYPLERYQTPTLALTGPDGRMPHSGAGLNVTPNPSRGHSTIRFSLPAPGSVRVVVYDNTGRLVRTLLTSRAAGKSGVLNWDCTDEFSETVDAGVYVVRLTAGSLTCSARLTVTK